MAKYAVSQEIMDILNANTWRNLWDIERFINRLEDDEELLMNWIAEGSTFTNDNERYADVITYVLTEREDLFEVEKPVMYYFYDDCRMFYFSENGSIAYSWTVYAERANMTLEEAQELYILSKSEDKKIVDSNGKVFIENCADLPF